MQLYDPATDTVYQGVEAAVPVEWYELSILMFRERALELLRSGQAEEAGRVEIGGLDGVRIVGPDAGRGGRSITYVVDAHSDPPSSGGRPGRAARSPCASSPTKLCRRHPAM